MRLLSVWNAVKFYYHAPVFVQDPGGHSRGGHPSYNDRQPTLTALSHFFGVPATLRLVGQTRGRHQSVWSVGDSNARVGRGGTVV
jgi:hypothetical protein